MGMYDLTSPGQQVNLGEGMGGPSLVPQQPVQAPPQQQGFDPRKAAAMIAALRQSGNQMPRGQMAGRMYIPPSRGQQLAGALGQFNAVRQGLQTPPARQY